MALSEFVALEAAYRALQPLDAAARGRALRWLTDALAVQDRVSKSPEPPVSGEIPVSTVPSSARPDAAVGNNESTPGEATAADLTDVVSASTADAADAGSALGLPVQETTRGSAQGTKRRASARSGRRGRSGKQPEKERVYRRMPPASEVLAAYKKVGTVSGLAGHFDVPRHTVQGWARRLRGAGYEIGRKSDAGE